MTHALGFDVQLDESSSEGSAVLCRARRSVAATESSLMLGCARSYGVALERRGRTKASASIREQLRFLAATAVGRHIHKSAGRSLKLITKSRIACVKKTMATNLPLRLSSSTSGR
jgi:hypothetical protein